MFKKTEGAVLDLTTPYGIGVREDAKARLKYRTLVQDYVELQKEADAMGSKLEASKQRKLMLAAEVRFLRRRRKLLVKMKNTNSLKEQSPLQAPGSIKRAKITKEQLLIGKEASQHGLPVAMRESLSLICTRILDLDREGIMHTRKEVFDRKPKERMICPNDATSRNSAGFDLNQDTSPGEREASSPA